MLQTLRSCRASCVYKGPGAILKTGVTDPNFTSSRHEAGCFQVVKNRKAKL